MATLTQLLPTADLLLQLAPEELGGVIIEVVAGGGMIDGQGCVHPARIADAGEMNAAAGYPAGSRAQVEHAFAEAWHWLLNEGLLMPAPGQNLSSGHCMVTRRGRDLRSKVDVDAYRAAAALPRDLLHSALREPVWQLFLRGDYDTAVFRAFRQVEVAVRTASNLSKSDIGTKLMQRAFGPGGPLRDDAGDKGEAEAPA
jgi:hypothetical protein